MKFYSCSKRYKVSSWINRTKACRH